MKTFKSIYTAKYNINLPDDSVIYNVLYKIGYDGYIPNTFITDLLIFSYLKLMNKNVSLDAYTTIIYNFLSIVKIRYWVEDTLYLLKSIAKKYDLRTIEIFAKKSGTFNLNNIKNSYNYVFDIKSISKDVIKFLNISENEILELEKLPKEIIEILIIYTGIGLSPIKSKSYVTSTNSMRKYGDITKISKNLFADPLFKYKFSIKRYDIPDIKTIVKYSNKLVIGYFFGVNINVDTIKLILKLIGIIAITNFNKGVRIVVYSFYMDIYYKEELKTIKDIINYFNSTVQLKLFSINNSDALYKMIKENPGEDILFIPNYNKDCILKTNSNIRVNIISSLDSIYNLKYANICKATKGVFTTV